MQIVGESRSLAAELGLLDTVVFFNSSRVDYNDRQNYLTEADAAVSTHHSHIETTFSFRTRILDYLWAELPMVVTAGDHFAELIEAEKLGIVVNPEDVDQLAAALERILFDDEFIAASKRNIRNVRARYFWEEALSPLLAFVADPHHSGDNEKFTQGLGRARIRTRQRRVQVSGFRNDIMLTIYHLRTSGPLMVLRKLSGRVRRMLS